MGRVRLDRKLWDGGAQLIKGARPHHKQVLALEIPMEGLHIITIRTKMQINAMYRRGAPVDKRFMQLLLHIVLVEQLRQSSRLENIRASVAWTSEQKVAIVGRR